MAGEESARYERIDELAEEFAARYRRGEHPSLEEYIERHPELADEIRELLPALVEVEKVKQDFREPAAPERDATPLLGQLGDFRVLREVGKGGMGIVYEAEQVSLGRRVALKVLPKKVLLDSQARQRFEREARAAAKLHHTNIVPVFGVGEHDGLPYYVMQFIHGLGLDEVLDELQSMQGTSGSVKAGAALRVSRKELSAAAVARSFLTGVFQAATQAEGEGERKPETTAPRSVSSSAVLPGGSNSRGRSDKQTYWQSVAHIGMQVADALDYAHKQGILHRDIKPSNLLLDTIGTVWVTDFGLAKTNDQQNITHTGDILGTLRYMPPEAFEGRTDPRSDVYSLGLTLYELLALQPAFGGSDRNAMIKQVMSTDPPRLDRLNPAIPRDLVTVVHKAIDRDSRHRYQTAAELAADLHRFINDEPIQARRPSQRERLWRWCRHYPGVASLTAALLLVLISVTVASVFAAAHFDQLASKESKSADNERQARLEEHKAKLEEVVLRDRARKSQRLAEANAIKARAAVDDYLTKVSQNHLLDVPGMHPLRRELLQSALKFYQEFVQQDSDDPVMRAELAATYLRVAQIQAELGESASAGHACAEGMKLYKALLIESPGSAEYQHGLARCHIGLGQLDAAIALWHKLVQPNQPRFQKELADAYNLRATSQARAGKGPLGLADHQKALAIRELLVRLRPADADAHRDLGQSLNNIGAQLGRANRVADALPLYRRAVAHAEIAAALAPGALVYRRALANFTRNMAVAEKKLGHHQEALTAYERVVEIRAKLARENQAVPGLQTELLAAYCDLVLHLQTLDALESAEQALRLAHDLIDRLPADGPEGLFTLACARAKFTSALAGEERKQQARLSVEALQKAIAAGFRELPRLQQAPELAHVRGRADFQAVEQELAAALAAEPADKWKATHQALLLRQKLADESPKNDRLQADLAASLHAIGLVEYDLGKLDEAAGALRQALSLREKLVQGAPKNGPYRMDLAATSLALGDVHAKAGRLAEWAVGWQTARDQLQAAVQAGPQDKEAAARLAAVMRAIIASHARTGLWDEAARQGEDRLKWADGAAHERFELACLHIITGNSDAYRQLCADFQARPGQSADLAYLAAAWGLAPRSQAEAGRILEWAGKAPAGSWPRFVLALAHYRAGQYPAAIAAAERSLKDNSWPSAIMNLPVLALAHHKLGQDAQARSWLEKTAAAWRRQSPLTRSITSPTALPDQKHYWDSRWGEWLTFQLLFREASLAIDGTVPAADALDQLHRGYLWSKLGDAKKAGALLDSAVQSRPDAEIWLARSVIFTALGQDDRADADLAAAAKLPAAPSSAALWIAYGRSFAEQGKHARAAAAFARAATLAAGELNQFVEAGWWVVATKDEDPRFPPGYQPDPHQPLFGIRTGAKLDWRKVPAGPDGRVDLRAVLQADHIIAHALTHVWSPQERTATLLVGGEDLRLWLNGRPVHQQKKLFAWKPRELDRVAVTLKAGRNTILCKVQQSTGKHYFYLRLADSTFDRGGDPAEKARAWLKNRDQATADYDLAIDLQPNEPGPLLARSRRYDELNRLKEADADFARAAALRPKDSLFWKQQGRDAAAASQWRWALGCYTQAEKSAKDEAPFMWYEKAALCVLTGDRDGYRRACEHCLRTRSRTVGFGYLAVRAGTLAPDALGDFAHLQKAADEEIKGKNAYHLLTIAAAVHYRGGRFQEAATMLRKSLDDNPSWDGKVLNWLWLSLACQRLGQEKEARQWLNKASEWLDRYPTGMPQQPEGSIGLQLHGWLEAQILRREAEALLGPGVW